MNKKNESLKMTYMRALESYKNQDYNKIIIREKTKIFPRWHKIQKRNPRGWYNFDPFQIRNSPQTFFLLPRFSKK